VARDAKVGVVMGGLSAERAVSLESGAAVAAGLRRRGWDAVELDMGTDLPQRLLEEGVQVAWLALHGRFGEDGCVQGMLEIMRIPYTGSGPTTSALAMDKLLTKRLLADQGLLLPGQCVRRTGDLIQEELLIEQLGLPIVAKTPTGGSTLGIALCRDAQELRAGLAECLQHGDTVLLESFVEGDEITVALLDGQALPAVEIRPDGGFFDFEAKYTKGRTRYIVPAQVSAEATRLAREQARLVASVLGLRGIARADFIVDAQDRPWFLEVNTIPGMTETSLSPMAAAEAGIGFDELVERVLLGASLELELAVSET